MPIYIEYQLDEDMTVLIEAPESEAGGIVEASRVGESVIVKAKKTFTESIREVKAQARLLLAQLEELPVSEAEVKFGMATSGELGSLVVGKIGLGVNYEVTLKWKKPKAAKSTG